MDPSFVFEDADDPGERLAPRAPKPAPAWELKDAIASAAAVKHKTKTFTTTDEKIRKVQQGAEEDAEEPPKKDKKKKKKRAADSARDDGGDGGGDEVDKAVEDPHDDFAKHDVVGTFLELNLSRVLCKACSKLGYENPTPIQSATIPLSLAGRDIVASAITGSGKTAAYGLPLLERLLHRPKHVKATYVLVLVPTRELAVQVHSMMQKLSVFCKDVSLSLVVGGLSMNEQAMSLRNRPEIVIATPNRMIDHLVNTRSVDLDDMSTLVLDEADRLLELGFQGQVKEIISHCPARRQTLLFSATMTESVKELVALSLRNPVRIAADPKHATPHLLQQECVLLKGPLASKKEAILLSLCTRLFTDSTVIFTRTKQYAHRLKLIFGLAGLRASELHGNMSQTQRLQALEDFRAVDAKFLIATDVASRGLDIVGVKNVISFDEPDVVTTYVHRIGRTARAGKEGRAVTLLDPTNRSLIKQIMKHSGKKLKQRVVSTESVEEWTKKIAAMAEDITTIQMEEKEERILQKAEMEAQRAQNLVLHDDEIRSRPARSWYQSTKEKREAQKMSREDFEVKSGSEDAVVRKKKRELRKKKAEEEGAKKRAENAREMMAASSAARAAKSHEKKLRSRGLGAQQATNIIINKNERSSSGSQSSKKRKASSQTNEGGSDDERGGDFKPKTTKAQKLEMNRRKRGGKAVKAFKSKKKYKRR